VLWAAGARHQDEEREREGHPAQQPEGTNPKVHYAAILLARIDLHTAGDASRRSLRVSYRKVKERRALRVRPLEKTPTSTRGNQAGAGAGRMGPVSAWCRKRPDAIGWYAGAVSGAPQRLGQAASSSDHD
jgi:hypothetical protein